VRNSKQPPLTIGLALVRLSDNTSGGQTLLRPARDEVDGKPAPRPRPSAKELPGCVCHLVGRSAGDA